MHCQYLGSGNLRISPVTMPIFRSGRNNGGRKQVFCKVVCNKMVTRRHTNEELIYSRKRLFLSIFDIIMKVDRLQKHLVWREVSDQVTSHIDGGDSKHKKDSDKIRGRTHHITSFQLFNAIRCATVKCMSDFK